MNDKEEYHINLDDLLSDKNEDGINNPEYIERYFGVKADRCRRKLSKFKLKEDLLNVKDK